MKTVRACIAAVVLMVSGTSAYAIPITLNTGFGGSDTETLTAITLGNAITFEYKFESVTFAGGPWLGFNASVVNPLLGAFPAGQFNDYKPSPTGWLSGSIDTSSGFGTLHDLALTASAFGAIGNAATILVRNVAIDGRIFAATEVPEPPSVALFLTAVAALALVRRRRGT